MSKTTSFALRLPPEMKAVAEALKAVHLYRPNRFGGDRGHVTGVPTFNINEALVSLILEGMEPTLGYVQAGLNEESEVYDFLQEIMKFFLENPTADRAMAHNFAAGSKARAYIEGNDAIDEEEEEGVSRADIAHEYAWRQQKLLDLTAAKGALQKVLQPLEAQAKEWVEQEEERRRERAAFGASAAGAQDAGLVVVGNAESGSA